MNMKVEKREKRLDISIGPCCAFRDPEDNLIVIHENRRLCIVEEFKGRIDND